MSSQTFLAILSEHFLFQDDISIVPLGAVNFFKCFPIFHNFYHNGDFNLVALPVYINSHFASNKSLRENAIFLLACLTIYLPYLRKISSWQHILVNLATCMQFTISGLRKNELRFVQENPLLCDEQAAYTNNTFRYELCFEIDKTYKTPWI